MTSERAKKMEPASRPVEAALEKAESMAEVAPDIGVEREHAVSHKLKDEARRSRFQALRHRGKVLTACGAPEKHVELIVSGQVRKESQVMKDLDRWHQGSLRICVLSGPVGVGKTVAAMRWLANFGGGRPCFVRAGDFEARGRYSHVWRDAWQTATGMVLDDLGCEYADAKGNLLADLDTLIDTYSAGRGRLVITTNLPWSSDEGTDFQKRYEDRIASRIIGSAEWINVVGPDLRRA